MFVSDLPTFIINLVSMVFTFGIVAAGVYIYRSFKGGTFAKPFLVLLLAPVFFLFSAISDLVGNVEIVGDLETGIFFLHLHDTFQLLFLVSIFLAMILFYRSTNALIS